jgi:hypothetical protein
MNAGKLVKGALRLPNKGLFLCTPTSMGRESLRLDIIGISFLRFALRCSGLADVFSVRYANDQSPCFVGI